MAEFDSAQALVDAARRTVAAGLHQGRGLFAGADRGAERHHPQEADDAAALVLAGGLTGMATGFALQYWASVIEYPMNVGGRPFASWPAFVIPSYELTILFSALTAAIGMIVLNGLPQPYHPVFNVAAVLAGELGQVLPGDRVRRSRSSIDATTPVSRGPGREGSL